MERERDRRFQKDKLFMEAIADQLSKGSTNGLVGLAQMASFDDELGLDVFDALMKALSLRRSSIYKDLALGHIRLIKAMNDRQLLEKIAATPELEKSYQENIDKFDYDLLNYNSILRHMKGGAYDGPLSKEEVLSAQKFAEDFRRVALEQDRKENPEKYENRKADEEGTQEVEMGLQSIKALDEEELSRIIPGTEQVGSRPGTVRFRISPKGDN